MSVSACWLLLMLPAFLIGIPVGIVVGLQLLSRVGDWKRKDTHR